MNNEEATDLLEAELAPFRAASYDDLVRRISTGAVTCERPGAGGATYQVEIEFFWDERLGGNVRVIGSIDDGRWRAIFPLSRSFLKSPDGSLVGEPSSNAPDTPTPVSGGRPRPVTGARGSVGNEQPGDESIWALKADLLSARVLVWVARAGRDAELTPEAHAYFCDRYRRLAWSYRRRGRTSAAARAEARAQEHCQDDGPFAAAMAMPRPTRWIRTWAVGDRHDPDDAA